MKTTVRGANADEFRYGAGKTHPFMLCVEDEPTAAHGHGPGGHEFPATRRQLRRLARQIAELLDD